VTQFRRTPHSAAEKMTTRWDPVCILQAAQARLARPATPLMWTEAGDALPAWQPQSQGSFREPAQQPREVLPAGLSAAPAAQCEKAQTLRTHSPATKPALRPVDPPDTAAPATRLRPRQPRSSPTRATQQTARGSYPGPMPQWCGSRARIPTEAGATVTLQKLAASIGATKIERRDREGARARSGPSPPRGPSRHGALSDMRATTGPG